VKAGVAVTDIGIQLDPDALRIKLIAALAPADRVTRAVSAQIDVPQRLGAQTSLDRVMDYPTFRAPMVLHCATLRPTGCCRHQ